MRFRFKIRYYDNSMKWGSDNRADISQTVRVLHISHIVESILLKACRAAPADEPINAVQRSPTPSLLPP